MKQAKRTAILLLALALGTLAGCGTTVTKEEPAQQETAVAVTDMMGREIRLTEPVTRVVALTAADCEILCAIGAEDTLVGRGEYCDYPPQVLDIPCVQSGSNTNLEEIIALQPQVVFMSNMEQTLEQAEQLGTVGISVVFSDAHSIEEVYTSIAMIGEVMGKQEQAAAVTAQMQETFARVQADALPEGEKTIYFEVSPLQYGLWTAGHDTFMDEIAAMLGLRNCFAEEEGWVQISQEQVMERNPDYIVTISMFGADGMTPEEEIASRPGWEQITAVQNQAILNLKNNELSRPCQRLAQGAELLRDFVCAAEEPAA